MIVNSYRLTAYEREQLRRRRRKLWLAVSVGVVVGTIVTVAAIRAAGF